MNKILTTIALSALVCTPVFAADTTWKEVGNPGTIVPAEGEYVVLISNETQALPEWAAIADSLVSTYKGKKVVWEKDVANALGELQKLKPRYIAYVAQAKEVDRLVVARLHRMTRVIEPDFYGDAIWGIISGMDAKAAARLADASEPLLLDRGFGTTNFDQQRFRTSFFLTDWGPNEYIETKSYVSTEKTPLAAGVEAVDIFADRWGEIQPQYVLTSSHATEFNLEMPFSKGLIASLGDKFYCFKTSDIRYFMGKMGNYKELEKVAVEKKMRVLPKSENPKVWIAAGNCLIGDAYRSKKTMVMTAISAANVKQFVGYTVTSWFGEGGWGTHLGFFNNHQDTSVGQAWFFNNQEILSRLPAAVRGIEIPMKGPGLNGIDYSNIAQIISKAGLNPDQTTIGRMHDRDVVAFYGNPLFRTLFNQKAKSLQPWEYKLFENGNSRRIVVTGTQNMTRKNKFNFWFPQVADSTQGTYAIKIFRKGKAIETVPADQIAFTKNFVMLKQEIELAPTDRIEILYTVK